MTKISFRPGADAPVAFTATRVQSRQGDRTRAMTHGRKVLITAEGETPALVVSTTANPGSDVIPFSPSSIWDAAKDLAGRAWDEINEFLTDEGGGGGVCAIVSPDHADIVTAAPAPALFRPRF